MTAWKTATSTRSQTAGGDEPTAFGTPARGGTDRHAARPRIRLRRLLRTHPVGKGKRRCLGVRNFIALIDGTYQPVKRQPAKAPIVLVWDLLRRRIAERLCDAIAPDVWVVEDVSFPKCGTASAGVARHLDRRPGAVGEDALADRA
ncbi:hypothetical protein SAMN02787118_14823 [Streptomyces mirabilis]|uniref:Transposase IS701-like DDE domain-containing protein n=1 Tax=Streptomyces mirabilis TaxID=68239 RepID=A0A1I2XK66_9ACTN|nr:transposase [Streptomyces mirabilis]SFH13898.1 hypothetical protein SAMN02787118_14823 [Streptomyces mirabilis]